MPHIGIVRIADKCKIGSNCSIDRGTLDDTTIGQSVMIDNLCHIAHNVTIGDRVIMSGQCGVSGSVNIGSNVMIGGQTGIAPHINVGEGAILMARSGVTKHVLPNSHMAGFPASDSNQFWREKAAVRRLAKKTLRSLQKSKK